MKNYTKIALVTGATRGVGREMVRQLAEAGVHTFLTGRNRDRAIAAALEFQAQGLPVEALSLDVTDPGSIAIAAHTLQTRHGRLDVLVNNAGVLMDEFGKIASEQTLEAWRVTFETNLFGLIGVTQAFLPLLHQSGDGCIVNVSSIEQPLQLRRADHMLDKQFKAPVHGVSKSAVNAWTLQLMDELRDTKIRTHCIDPGDHGALPDSRDGRSAVRESARRGTRLVLTTRGVGHVRSLPSHQVAS